jgi:outer membrane lipoprotein-sorting protein
MILNPKQVNFLLIFFLILFHPFVLGITEQGLTVAAAMQVIMAQNRINDISL